METTQANGHHTAKTLQPVSLTLSPEPLHGLRYELVLQLVREAVELEVRLKETLKKLDAEMRDVGHQDLPSVLLALARRDSEAAPPVPTVASPTIPAPNVGGALKAKIMGLMSDKKERRAGAIIKRLRLHPNTAYTLLNVLVNEGHLVRTKYAHYRLKLRG